MRLAFVVSIALTLIVDAAYARRCDREARWEASCFVNRDGTLGEPLTYTRSQCTDKGRGYDLCRYEGRTFSRTLNYPTSEELRDGYKLLSTVLVDYD